MSDIIPLPTPFISFPQEKFTKAEAWLEVQRLSQRLGFSPHVWRKDHTDTNWCWYVADIESIRNQEAAIGRRVSSDSTAWNAITWDLLQTGQQVWLAGEQEGRFKAFGPFIVDDPKGYTLVDAEGARFAHHLTNLIILEWSVGQH